MKIFVLIVFAMIMLHDPSANASVSCYRTSCPVVLSLDWSSKTIEIRVYGQPVQLNNARFSVNRVTALRCSSRFSSVPIESPSCSSGDLIMDRKLSGFAGTSASGSFAYVDSAKQIIGVGSEFESKLGTDFNEVSVDSIAVAETTARRIVALVRQFGAQSVWISIRR